MKQELERRSLAISKAGRKMDDALARLGSADPYPKSASRRARLIFGLDLTGSREASLHQAQIATTAMFEAIRSIGTIAVKLIYYRGGKECRASAWHDDPRIVADLMQKLVCETGSSQIRRILKLALAEAEILDGVVFIGDQCEEDADRLCGLAADLGARKIPLFLFHECNDFDQRSQEAKPLFQRMAELSGGIYCEFKPGSADALRELLSTLGAFSLGRQEAIKQMAPAITPAARQLQKRLLLLAAPVLAAEVPNFKKVRGQ